MNEKFRYLIINIADEDAEVAGTNSEQEAIRASVDDDLVVIDSEINCVIRDGQGQGPIKQQTWFTV